MLASCSTSTAPTSLAAVPDQGDLGARLDQTLSAFAACDWQPFVAIFLALIKPERGRVPQARTEYSARNKISWAVSFCLAQRSATNKCIHKKTARRRILLRAQISAISCGRTLCWRGLASSDQLTASYVHCICIIERHHHSPTPANLVPKPLVFHVTLSECRGPYGVPSRQA